MSVDLKEYVNKQKLLLELIEESDEMKKEKDRLDLILETKIAITNISNIVKGFDKWLEDPTVIRHMPKEMLEEVRNTFMETLKTLLKLDIKHTSEYIELIEKLSNEGKLDPLVFGRKDIKKTNAIT